MQHSPNIHIDIHQGQRLQYIVFDSPKVFTAFVEQQCNNLEFANKATMDQIETNAKHRINTQSDWYGTPIPKSIAELAQHRYFEKMHLLETLAPKIKAHFYKYQALTEDQLIQRPKLTTNSKGLGVFSFDRAVMGLYKQPLGKGNTVVESLSNQLKIAVGKDKGTTVKDTHLYFKHTSNMRPSLTINLLAGGNANVKGDALYYVGIACALLVDYLESCQIAVAVNVLIGTTIQKDSCLSVIQVKRFEDPLDQNQLLVLSSDPRYFRYNGFKAVIATADYCGLTIPESLGYIHSKIAHQYAQSSKSNSVVFQQSYSVDKAVAEVVKHLKNYTASLKK